MRNHVGEIADLMNTSASCPSIFSTCFLHLRRDGESHDALSGILSNTTEAESGSIRYLLIPCTDAPASMPGTATCISLTNVRTVSPTNALFFRVHTHRAQILQIWSIRG